MTDQNTSAPVAVSRRFKWLLGVSLALNLLVLGAVAGAILRGGPSGHGARADRGGAKFAAPYIRALSPQDQRMVRRNLHQAAPTRRDMRADRAEKFAQMLLVLRAPELDVSAVRKVLSSQRAASLQFQNIAQDQWLKVISGMSRAERLTYADAVEAEIARGPKRHGGRRESRHRD